MSIRMVNGYACASCEDVAKAKRGENPARADEPSATKPAPGAAMAGAPGEPAVIYGGSLTAPAGVSAGAEARTDDPGRRPRVDIVA
jgi:hypothetical protein